MPSARSIGMAALLVSRGGTALNSRSSAASFSAPVGFPFASRTITPPAGSGVCAVMPASFKRQRVRQHHVAVVAVHGHRSYQELTESINSLVGSSAGVHFVSSQSPPSTHSPLAVFAARSRMRRANSCGAGRVVQFHVVELRSAVDESGRARR